MPKGPIVTHEIQAFIASIYGKHPKWKAKEVCNEVRSLLRKNNPKLPSEWPSLSTVQKVLATVRKNMKEMPLDPRDKPWSTPSMVKYPIPPEALPAVLIVWFWVRENLDIDLTIREAQWVARLYATAKNIPIVVLSFISRAHAATEMIYERIGAPYESKHNLDFLLYSFMTKRETTDEWVEKVLERWDEGEEWYFSLSDREASILRSKFQTKQGERVAGFEVCEVMEEEAQNERPHTKTG